MNNSKERAWEIINIYLSEVKKLAFVKSVILVGSLSDDTYTANPGSDIDLTHIVSDDVDYEEEKKSIFSLIDEIEKKTNRDVPIARVVYQRRHLIHPYQYDFELSYGNKSLINRPIEVFRILDSGMTLYGEDYKDTIERPTHDDVLASERLEQAMLEIVRKSDPEWYQQYNNMKKNPSVRIMTQIVITSAMLEYFYYTDKSCSSKYQILKRMEEDVPSLSYLNLLKLCHKNRFTPEKITNQEIEVMKREYQEIFLERPMTWK